MKLTTQEKKDIRTACYNVWINDAELRFKYDCDYDVYLNYMEKSRLERKQNDSEGVLANAGMKGSEAGVSLTQKE